MINLDNIVNNDNEKHNEKWPYIPDHPYRILNMADLDHEKQIHYFI